MQERERQKERNKNMTAAEMSEGSGNYLDKETERGSERTRDCDGVRKESKERREC